MAASTTSLPETPGGARNWDYRFTWKQIIPPVWEGLAGFVDQAIEHAGDPDQGIWEIRGSRSISRRRP